MCPSFICDVKDTPRKTDGALAWNDPDVATLPKCDVARENERDRSGSRFLSRRKKNAPAEAGAPSPSPQPGYWQPGNLNDAMRVLQLNAPLVFRYSLVYQNVQSSTGSTVIAL